MEKAVMELKLNGVTKRFGKKIALSDVSMTLTNGVYALLGPNGAGKTTLIRLLMRLLLPDSGTVCWNGKPICSLGSAYLSVIGYLPQYPQFYRNFRADEFLLYMAKMKGITKNDAKARAEKLLEQVNLTQDAHRYIGQFSGGMRQRLGIAQALLNDPELLVLDEPTAGLDPKERIRFRNLLSSLSEKRVVLLATHIVSDAEAAANTVLLLKSGQVIGQDTPEQLMQALAGRVWSCSMTQEELAQMNDRLCISRAVLQGGAWQIHAVSDLPPVPRASLPRESMKSGIPSGIAMHSPALQRKTGSGDMT